MLDKVNREKHKYKAWCDLLSLSGWSKHPKEARIIAPSDEAWDEVI